MSKTQILKQILDEKLISIVRLKTNEHTIAIVEAIYQGGLRCIEVTCTTPGALEAIKQFVENGPKDLLIGVGSVIDGKTAQDYITAGAQFIVTPAVQEDVITVANKADIPVVCGAFTPTEVVTAYRLGCELVKIFPAEFLGPSFIKAIKAPLPYINLAPTGGVKVDNVGEWLASGASALGIGSSMLAGFEESKANYQIITDNAQAFACAVKNSVNN